MKRSDADEKKVISLMPVPVMALGFAAFAEGAEPVTVRVATFRYEDETIYQELVRMFNEQHPEITVELEFNPEQTAHDQALQADIMDGSAPDVFDMHANEICVG